ncbi:MAG: flagellar M-ring protein FliF [Candidatus Rokubacteria bacterium]|nr:flagellar M-ring protein FliF [Candidatus Rokubacteria bacterium]
MPPRLEMLLVAARAKWATLPSRTRWSLLVAVGALGLTVTLLSLLSGPRDFQILFANLPPEDATAVTEALRQARVPTRLAEGGKQILVSAAQVHEWRLKLASQGLPSAGSPGFELFDKSQFGTTDFAQRLNFQRALQGELARTIGQVREVLQARVHLAMPAPRLFSTQDRPASASVVVRLKPGTALRPDQVRGIVHLVSGAVEGLSPDRVTVLDTSGRVLGSGADRSVGGLSGSQQEARATLEAEIERRVQTLLDPVVGPGHSAVRVAAHVNFDQVERTEERFDPNSVVKQETRSNESSQGTSSQPSGVPGPESPQTPLNASNSRTQREAEQITYEISRTVQKTVVAPGEVKRLSVAVLLDTPIVQGKRPARTPAEIERIRRLVQKAAGILPDRGDEVEVAEIPFDVTQVPEREPSAPATRPARAIPSWAWTALSLAVAVSVALVLLEARRRRKIFEEAVAASAVLNAPAPLEAPEPIEEKFAPEPLELKQKDMMKQRVLAAAKQHPDEVVQLLRVWMLKRKVHAG